MEVDWEDVKMNNSGVIPIYIYEDGPHRATLCQSSKPKPLTLAYSQMNAKHVSQPSQFQKSHPAEPGIKAPIFGIRWEMSGHHEKAQAFREHLATSDRDEEQRGNRNDSEALGLDIWKILEPFPEISSAF